MTLVAVLMKVVSIIAFIITGGAVFSSWGRRHPALAMMAASIALVGSYYTFKSIAQDLQDASAEGVSNERASSGDPSRESVHWGPSAVWSPPDNIETYTLCDNLAQRRSANCVLDVMRELGAPLKAIEFSEVLAAFGMNDSYMYGFRELGTVDVALVVNPHVMSGGGYFVFVNGYPELISLQDLTNWQVRTTESIRMVRSEFPQHPNAEIWFPIEIIGAEADSNVQSITIKWDIRNGCNACEMLGYAFSDYRFNESTGKFLDFQFYGVVRK